MAILIDCVCSKKIKASDEQAGRKVRCPGCGAILEVPGGEPAAAPRAPLARRRHAPAPAPSGKLPGAAIGLAIVNFLDAAVIGLVAIAIVLLGGMASAAGSLGESLESGLAGMADDQIAAVKAEGGKVLEDRVVTKEDGTKARRVKTMMGGSTTTMEFPVAGAAKRATGEMQSVGGVLVLVGLLALLASGGKLVAGIGLLMRRNWGRVGLIGLCALEALLLVVLMVTGGSGAWLAASVLLNVGTAAYCASAGVAAATRAA